MELVQRREDGQVVIGLSGKCTVEHARQLRDAMLAAADAPEGLALDLAEVTEVDITLLQLLLSAALTMEACGKTLTRVGELSPAVRDAARVSGFNQSPRLKTFFSDEGRDG